MIKCILILGLSLIIGVLLMSDCVKSEYNSESESESFELNANQKENELLRRIFRHNQVSDMSNRHMIAQKRFPKWRGSKVNSKMSLTKMNSLYGHNNDLRKMWDKTMKMKNKIYEKNNLLDY